MAKKIFLIALIFICFSKGIFGMQPGDNSSDNPCDRIVEKSFCDGTKELSFENFSYGEIEILDTYLRLFVLILSNKLRSIRMSGFSLSEIEHPELFFSYLLDLDSMHISFVVPKDLLKLSKSKTLRRNLKNFSVSFFEIFNSENPINWVEVCGAFTNLETLKLCFEEPEKSLDEEMKDMIKALFGRLPNLKSVFIAYASNEVIVFECSRKGK